MSVNVGDRVRIGRGSVEHVVEWVQGNRARLRSAHRSVMASVDRLTVVEPATRQAGRSIEYAPGGCIRVDGEVFRAADRWTEVVVDWDGVRIGGRSYADQPSVVICPRQRRRDGHSVRGDHGLGSFGGRGRRGVAHEALRP